MKAFTAQTQGSRAVSSSRNTAVVSPSAQGVTGPAQFTLAKRLQQRWMPLAAASTTKEPAAEEVTYAVPIEQDRDPFSAGTTSIKRFKQASGQTGKRSVSGSRRLSPAQLQAAERTILNALSTVKGRGKEGLSAEQLAALEQAVDALEASARTAGAQPVARPDLNGKWRLLYTSRPGTASPIQRTFTGVEAFSVYQEVDLAARDDEGGARVTNVVDFGPRIGYLRVEAQASTDARPLEGFTPRKGAGLPLFGKSETYPPERPGLRIDFQFDQAAFYFKFLPFTLPYPVPFRLLGDETKGWLDVTYLSPDATFRLSRGNKGTLFILTKELPLRRRLELALAAEDEEQILSLIPLLEAESPTPAPARSPLAAGMWRLVWSQQAEDASALQRFGSKQSESFQIIGEDGSLQNLVNLGFAKISAQATCAPASDTRTDVLINSASISLGPLKIPLPFPKARSSGGSSSPTTSISAGASSSPASSSSSPSNGSGAGGSSKAKALPSSSTKLAATVYTRNDSKGSSKQGIKDGKGSSKQGVKDSKGSSKQGVKDISDNANKGGLSDKELSAAAAKVTNPGWVDWLYLDEDIRITRGSKGSLFIHKREKAQQV